MKCICETHEETTRNLKLTYLLFLVSKNNYISFTFTLHILTIILEGEGGNFIPCSFSLNNSGTVKAVTLPFCSIQQHFIRNIPAKFGIPNSPQFLDIWKNSDGGIPNFRNSGQSLIKENCHNSRTGDGIEMKPGKNIN